jgi:hypothetical protein
MFLAFPFYLAQMTIIYGQKKGTVLCNFKTALSAKNIYRRRIEVVLALTALVHMQQNLLMLILMILSLFYYNIKYQFNDKYNYDMYIDHYKILESCLFKCIRKVQQLKKPC